MPPAIDAPFAVRFACFNKRVHDFLTHTSLPLFINNSTIMASINIDLIGIDSTSETSNLTTFGSGNKPTLPSDESPTIQALTAAKDEAAYDLIYASIPREHRVKIYDVHYVKYEPYRSKRSKRNAWYWNPTQAQELIRVTKGKYSLFLILTC
jgi:hypothetical protein